MFRGRIPTSVRLEEVQAEQLIEVAAYLRQCREVCGLSLDEMASKTLIQRRTLQALEEADITRLPEPVYVRGFIRRYASALGLKGEDVAEAYPIELGVRRSSTNTIPGLNGVQLRPIHLYLLYLGVIGVAVNGLSGLMAQSWSPQTVTQVTPPNLESVRDRFPAADAVARATAPETSEAAATQSASAANLAQVPRAGVSRKVLPDDLRDRLFPLGNKPDELVRITSLRDQLQAIVPSGDVAESKATNKAVQVTMKLVDKSWVRVTVDGKAEVEDVLAEGTQRTWQANETIVVRAGNAGGVMIGVGNEPLKPLGVPGSVEERQYGSGSKTTASISLKQMSAASLAAIGD